MEPPSTSKVVQSALRFFDGMIPAIHPSSQWRSGLRLGTAIRILAVEKLIRPRRAFYDKTSPNMYVIDSPTMKADGWILALTIVTALATIGQCYVAYRVYMLQQSNERIANRIELLARLQPDIAGLVPQQVWKLTISNLSTFGVWIEYVTVQAVSKGKLVEATVRFESVIQGAGFVERHSYTLPLEVTIRNYTIVLRARGKQSIFVTNSAGMASSGDSGENRFSWVSAIMEKFNEIDSYKASGY